MEPRNGQITQLLAQVMAYVGAAIFIYAGASKLMNPTAFAQAITDYRLVPWWAANALGLYLPWVEVTCGIALIWRPWRSGALVILTGLCGVFVLAAGSALLRGINIDCGCFGTSGAREVKSFLPVTRAAIILTLALVLLIREMNVPNSPKT